MTEFEIIKQYFATQSTSRTDVIQSIGDDAAILQIPPNQSLCVTTDTLVSGVHFYASDSAFDIGYKSLAVNLSDLAAMGATPAWVTLALTMPSANESWIQGFCEGLFTLANRLQVQLVGGDLTHGPLAITITAMGFTPPGKALLRSAARPGDLIYVTGTLGDAGFALQALAKQIPLDETILNYFKRRLHRPEPRVAIGEHLRDLAHACIDISDGLAADLSHILDQSQVGATVCVDQLPLSNELKSVTSLDKAIALALNGGDDYELCFTVPPDKKEILEKNLAMVACPFTSIGTISAQSGLGLHYQNGNDYHGAISGYEHF